MRLTKLELQGFKSFARKTEIIFDNGITAVIGPNGSGKSNIADAVRWVLGEQSAKALRGARMEDVIFNGTQERKAQSFCEVMLTFDNSDGTLPIDFNEVTVTRRVYRSGESEYAINRNNCRLKDIMELFRDTGIGKEGYSIIGQGRVDEILSNKSNDRRAAIEEAAGIMRYRARKEEAVRKLENTRKNLERLNDILDELENQREPLYEQAEKAKTYLTLRDELKELDLNVFLHQYERMQDRMKNATAAVAQLTEERTLQADTERALAAECAAQEDELLTIEKAAEDLQNRLISEMSALDAHSGEVNVYFERQGNLEKDCTRLQAEVKQEQEKCEDLQAKLELLSASGSDRQTLLAALDEKIANEQATLLFTQQSISSQEALVETQKSSIIEQLNRLSDAKSQLSRMEAMVSALEERRAVVSGQIVGIEGERQSLVNEQTEARKEWDADAALYNERLQEQKQKQQALDDGMRAYNEAVQQSHALEQELNGMRSRANVLAEMARAHEGYYASVRNVLRDCDRDASLRRCVLGVVAELIQVPKEYEVALEMTLGSALQNIVTPTPEDAKRVIEHLRQNKYGRATMLPVSDVRPRTLSREERDALAMAGCIGVASELIGYHAQYKGVVEYLLGRTVIVETLDAGITLNRRVHSGLRIATLQGDIINPGGSMTGGSVQKREFSLLGRERELKQLNDDMAAMQKKMALHAQTIQEALAAAEAKKQALLAMDALLHAQEIETARHKEKLDLIQRDINQNQEKLNGAQLELSQIEDNLADLEKERMNITQLQSGIEAGNAVTQEEVQQSQQKLARLRDEYDQMSEKLTERKVERMAFQKEEDASMQEFKRLERELMQAQAAIDKAKKTLEENDVLGETISAGIEALNVNIGDERKLVEMHKEQQQALNEERARRAEALKQARARRDDLNALLHELDERKHKQELILSRVEVEFAAMQERIATDYEMTYEDALPLRKEGFGVTAAHVRIDKLRAEIRELGNINVNAVEDYATLKERHDTLTLQCEDLTHAEADLNTLIDELTGNMEKQFREQFAIIQKNFSAVFAQLFDGGYAELRLADEKDPLNCEIDIIAQPPGKKLQLLTLLSGGERALTAIALLFAMLRLKPTVFCILDEIETSLDEVNVARFAGYLKRYSKDTQFILITHRKGSMEVCNALYGVAMEEKGVSRLVSARFEDTRDAAV